MQGSRWLVAALAVVAVMGVVQSVQIERSTSYGLTRVLYRASSHAMADLARDGSTQMRDEFAFYAELRPYVAGSRLVVPRDPGTLTATSVRGLSGAELIVSDYDPTIGPVIGQRLRGEASLLGPVRSSAGTFEVVGPEGPAPVFVLLLDEHGTVYVTAVDQLARHGIEPAGLDPVELLAAGVADG
jgi:hypothetical protein